MILSPLFCFKDTKNTRLLTFNSLKQKKLIFNFVVNRNWKKLTDSRKRAKILADNRKSYHPIETLKYGLAGGRGHRVHKTETQATTLMARPLGPSDGVVLEYIDFHQFQCRTESFNL